MTCGCTPRITAARTSLCANRPAKKFPSERFWKPRNSRPISRKRKKIRRSTFTIRRESLWANLKERSRAWFVCNVSKASRSNRRKQVPGNSALASLFLRLLLVVIAGGSQRKLDAEGGPFSLLALDRDRAPMQVDDLTDDRKTQSCAALLRGEERLKQTPQRLLIDS